jgi:hypothetical protein
MQYNNTSRNGLKGWVKFLLFCLFTFLPLYATAQKAAYTLQLTVSDKDTSEPVIMASVQLQPTGIMAVTDMDGHATLRNVPAGTYRLNISYVGYEPVNTSVKVGSNLKLNYRMTQTTLALQEVNVVARQKAGGASTTSVIGRQAIDHLQALSLADVMQLIPGQLMTNTDLTAQTNLQLRTLSNNNTAAFGSGVIMDGMPVSNNGTVEAGGFSATAFTGTDLRNFSADDVQEVEVIRGIPSAEYGDLTSGLMVVKSKIGVTPWQLKGKVNPGLMNYSLGKGLRMNRYGVLNFNVDYAQAWGDPRMKTKSFDRYTLSVGYGLDITRRWHTDTKLRYTYAKDWNGNDPDAKQDGTQTKNVNKTMTLTHNGRISVDRRFARTLSYTVGLTLTGTDNTNTRYVPTSSGVVHIVTARETGYYEVPWLDHSYLATGYTESRPGNLYAKLNNDFHIKTGSLNQRFKMGMDYHYDWNSGKGYYNADEHLPLKPNENGRPRAFSDVPGLHQIAAYLEDNFNWEYAKGRHLRVVAGARLQAMQPFSDVSTLALSPRLNITFEATKWLTIRGGIGLNSKAPGLNYLYPDNNYKDHIALAYYAGGSTAPDQPGSMVVNHTYVQPVTYSRGLKNATTTKIEAGIDIKLPGGRKLSLTAYQDKTPNGFSSDLQYVTYESLQYATPTAYADGTPNDVPSIFWTTNGQVSNDNVLQNRGVEFDFDLGRIKPLNTSIYFSGAWQESKSWSKGLNTSNPQDLPADYKARNTTPYKLVYPSGVDYSRTRRFVNTLRLVTNIPQLRMVASFTGQVIWHSSNYSFNADKDPYAFITPDLQWHAIGSDQLNGYLDTDGNWSSTQPASGISLQSQLIRPNENKVVKEPVTWNLSARLTKEFGKFAGLSFYANNVLYYEPFMTTNTSGTLTQRNASSYSFGVELFFNL